VQPSLKKTEGAVVTKVVERSRNAVGRRLTEETLRRSDTDGGVMRVGEIGRGRASARGAPADRLFHTTAYIGKITQALYPHRHAEGTSGRTGNMRSARDSSTTPPPSTCSSARPHPCRRSDAWIQARDENIESGAVGGV